MPVWSLYNHHSFLTAPLTCRDQFRRSAPTSILRAVLLCPRWVHTERCYAARQVLNEYRSMDDFAKIRMLGYESVAGPGLPTYNMTWHCSSDMCCWGLP